MADDPKEEDTIRLVSSKKGDADIAAELRAELEPVLRHVAAIMDRANAAGFAVAYNIAPNPPLMKNQIGQLHLLKYY